MEEELQALTLTGQTKDYFLSEKTKECDSLNKSVSFGGGVTDRDC